MPQASVKRLIEVEKDNLINLVLDIDKSFNPDLTKLITSFFLDFGWINSGNSS